MGSIGKTRYIKYFQRNIIQIIKMTKMQKYEDSLQIILNKSQRYKIACQITMMYKTAYIA